MMECFFADNGGQVRQVRWADGNWREFLEHLRGDGGRLDMSVNGDRLIQGGGAKAVLVQFQANALRGKISAASRAMTHGFR